MAGPAEATDMLGSKQLKHRTQHAAVAGTHSPAALQTA
jgi:hypothetical protein